MSVAPPPIAMPEPASGRFSEGMHYFPVRIYFEDTDTGGVVYHANYLRFMERARSDMLRLLGIDQRGSIAAGEGVYTVARAALVYRLPAHLDDDLIVVSQVKHISGATCTMDQRIMRGSATVVSGEVTVAFVSSNGRPKRQPKAWVALFNRIAQGEDISL